MDNNPNSVKEYFAFISYKREDEKWAKWLQRKLEYYKFPVSVRNKHHHLPERVRPIFKDTTDLSGGSLEKAINHALSQSQYLIVICSPKAAQSPWVCKEVSYFIENNRHENIIPFIIDGEPNSPNIANECFPKALKNLSGEQELLGININEMGRNAAAIKVVARMFNIRFDSLWQRHERVRKRKASSIILTAILALLSSIFIGYLYLDRNYAYNSLSSNNTKLEKAYNELASYKDSILKSNYMLNKIIHELDETNHNLDQTNISLNIEKNKVSQTLEQVKYEQFNLVANTAQTSLRSGFVLSAIRKILPLLPNSSNNQPLVPLSLDVLNEAMAILSQRGFKCIDKLPTDSLFSPNSRWCAYNDCGEYYLYDLHSQISYKLPGEDCVDLNTMFFSKEGDNLHGIGNSMWYNWDTNTKELKNTLILNYDSIYSLIEDIENFPKYSYRHSSNDKIWGNYSICYFNSFDNKDHKFLFAYYNKQLIRKIPLKKNFSLNKDYNFSPQYPMIAYREDDERITVYDLKHDKSERIYFNRNELDSTCNTITVLNTGKEIVVKNQLFSCREVPIMHVPPICTYKDSISMSANYEKTRDAEKHFIEFEDETWSLIDSKNGANLYINTRDIIDTAFGELLFVTNSFHHKFRPFIAYSLGNGIGMMNSAKILSDSEILIIASQGAHFVYNTTTMTRKRFSFSQLNDFSRFAHYQIFLSGDFLIDNDSKLLTISTGGILTLYDIETGYILMECFIIPPSLNSEAIYQNFIPFHISNDGKLLYGRSDDGEKEYYCCYRLPSIVEYCTHSITAFDNFWKTN